LIRSLYAIPVLALLLLAVAPVTAATPLTISTSGGSLYFPGESAVVYFTVTANGALVNPDTTTATLYLPNNANSFALTPVSLATGVFYVNYTLPDPAVYGTYAVVITSSYQSGAFVGSTVASFEVSQGLANMQANELAAVGVLSDQLSTAESNILSTVASGNAMLGSVNSSLTNSIAGVQSSVTTVGASVSSLGTSVSNLGTTLQGSISSSQTAVQSSITTLGTTLQGSITSSQSAVTAAISQGTTSVQGSITSAQSAIVSAVNSASSSVTSSINSSLTSIQNYEYILMVLVVIAIILAIIVLVRKK